MDTVFIGNIPYEATEEELLPICAQVGNVKVLRFIFDKDSGGFRGFAFCTFVDDDVASSAIRHLNGTVLRGRTLRFKRANTSGREGHRKRERSEENAAPRPVPNRNLLEESDVRCLVATRNNSEQRQILEDFRALISQNPGQARGILRAHPEFSYALLMMLRNVSDSDVDS
jgi:cleavage stimulation factor subunit 2